MEFLKALSLNWDGAAGCGGKAAGLAAARAAGVRVPDSVGFRLGPLGEWLAALPGHAEARHAWAFWTGEEPAELRAFRERVLGASMPVDWTACVDRVRAALGKGALFVRSSMSAEDAPSASLAGAFRTVRVPAATVSAESLWAAAREVLASAFEPAAARQILAAGLDPGVFAPGFLIQKEVPAVLAGVAFSRHPEALWAEGGLVEWVAGAGEAVVQGTAREAGRASAGDAPPAALAAFWSELWRAVAALERQLEGPTDAEWVWDGQALWIVQARVIATEAARLIADAPGARWTRALSLERFPEPITPLGWTAIADSMDSNLVTLEREFGIVVNRSRKMAVRFGARVYSDPDFFAFPGRARVQWWRYLAPWRPHLARAFVAVGRFVAATLSGGESRAARALLKLDLIEAAIGPQSAALAARWDRHVREGRTELERFGAGLATGVQGGAAVLLSRMNELREISLRFMQPDFAVFVCKEATHAALGGVCAALGRGELELGELVSAFTGNRTVEMGEAWARLIAALKNDPKHDEFVRRLGAGEATADASLGEAARAGFREFLARNGHNRTSWDLAVPCWSDAPARLAPSLAASLRGSCRADVGTAERQHAAERALLARLAELGHGRAAPRVKAALAELREQMRIDEELHFLTGLVLEPSRRLVLAAAELLTAKGLLAVRDDVFFLELAELKDALLRPTHTLRFLAEKRRAEMARAALAVAPEELPPKPEEPRSVPDMPGTLHGVAVSRGLAEGITLVAEHLDGAGAIAPGTVLVTTAPNPALVPLYPLLTAIVSVTGGLLSHGFVAAREFGLPAVSGIKDAHLRLKTGTRVRVDGARGVVEVL